MNINIEQVERVVAKHNLPLPDNFPDLNRVGDEIGKGIHGTVYRYGKGRVIKFGCHWAEDEKFKALDAFVKKTKRHKAVVDIYSCGRLGDKFYWLVMEYLPKEITRKERDEYWPRVEGHMSRYWYKDPFWTKSSRYDLNQFPKKWKTMLRSMATIKEKHLDLHSGNVRRNGKGEPKMIDIESFI